MKKQPNKTQAGTNVEKVKQQNAGAFAEEFASETNAAEVKKQNRQSEANKGNQQNQQNQQNKQ
ncbi:gamma-type small acid-soluble spore protein [Jeotgalibacillus salarius]|uniref:Small, acid-soluble spore protein gamma-type n=1 Tax=Jeotgalibacillus salarius TaxID=546023 RepID=A0A4Y8LF72_9BACL|nr:gamma-type small acid-soluble spore protein [Jeotgalibacillus salarius]TFD99640.1 gamma-type small acid-soluble spore protein [Jeotgalibacillus salarius]